MLATARRYYAEQQELSALAVRQLRGRSSVSDVLRLLPVYQARAALLAVERGVEALSEQDISSDGPRVQPVAFTVTPGAPTVLDDVDTGLRFDRIVASLVNDAGRSAMGAFTASRNREVGHIRTLTAPSCSRCAILAGRFYRWSDGFQRHPKCDCTMIPGTASAGLYDPRRAFERGEMTDLTKAQVKAVEAGADIGRVVNTRSGMQVASFAGRTSRGRNARLSPEAIYNVSGNDRAEAIRLLRANGYLA